MYFDITVTQGLYIYGESKLMDYVKIRVNQYIVWIIMAVTVWVH